MDDPVTMADILMVSFFSFILWYAEKRYRLGKESELKAAEPPKHFTGRKFYWICVNNGEDSQFKIWTKQDST